MSDADVLTMTTLDGATYQTYARTAAALRASTPALLRHTLTALAPALAAAERAAQGANREHLCLHAALAYGDVVFDGASRCALTAEAVSAHEHAAHSVAAAHAVLERSQQVYADAAALARSRARREAARIEGGLARS